MTEKNEQKKHLIDMMKLDEEAGLYDETEHLLSTQANRNRLLCKDCNKSLDDCTCIEDTIELPNQVLIDAAQRYEKYSERFDNDESAIGNPETWGKRVLTEEDIFNQRDIDTVTDYINKETLKQETLEEVLGSSMCQFSVIENKLAILYRNQVKIYDAVTKEKQGYSEEDMIAFGKFIFKNTLLVNVKGVEGILEQFKNK
mgnify:CR=1 FL=1